MACQGAPLHPRMRCLRAHARASPVRQRCNRGRDCWRHSACPHGRRRAPCAARRHVPAARRRRRPYQARCRRSAGLAGWFRRRVRPGRPGCRTHGCRGAAAFVVEQHPPRRDQPERSEGEGIFTLSTWYDPPVAHLARQSTGRSAAENMMELSLTRAHFGAIAAPTHKWQRLDFAQGAPSLGCLERRLMEWTGCFPGRVSLSG